MQAPLDISPLPHPPKAGIKVAAVLCSVPACGSSQIQAPANALHWNLKTYIYQLTGPQAQSAALESAIQEHPSYIFLSVLFPLSTDKTQLQQAAADHIKVATQLGTLQPGAAGCFACASALVPTGQLAGAVALSSAGAKTTVAIATNSQSPGIAQKTAGAVHEIQRYGEGSTADVFQVPLSDSPTQSGQLIESYLQSHPAVKYLILSDVDWLDGLSGVPSSVKVIGDTLENTDIQALHNGQLYAGVSNEDYTTLWRAFDLFARLSEGQNPPTSDRVPVGWHRIFTASNVGSANGNVEDPPNYQKAFENAWK